MVPCSCNSIVLSALLYPTSPNSNVINDTYDQFGPTPRLCLETAAFPEAMAAYGTDVRGTLAWMTLETLRQWTVQARDLKMDGISDKLCLIRREKRNTVSSLPLVMPITDHIASKLSLHMRNASFHQLMEEFRMLFPLIFWREMTGYIFENICHQGFQKQIHIKYVPMVQEDRRHRPKWRSSHQAINKHDAESQALEKLRQDALSRCETLDVRPSDIRSYDDLDFAPERNVYYIPKSPSELAFIHCGDRLYIFQFTVSSEHGIKDGLIAQFAKCHNLPQPGNWRFIFIIPSDIGEIESPCSNSLGLTPFSSRVAMDDFAKLMASSKQREENEGCVHKKVKRTHW